MSKWNNILAHRKWNRWLYCPEVQSMARIYIRPGVWESRDPVGGWSRRASHRNPAAEWPWEQDKAKPSWTGVFCVSYRTQKPFGEEEYFCSEEEVRRSCDRNQTCVDGGRWSGRKLSRKASPPCARAGWGAVHGAENTEQPTSQCGACKPSHRKDRCHGNMDFLEGF